MRPSANPSDTLASALVQDELFDLTLYKSLRPFSPPYLQKILDDLIPVETRHYGFWKDFFKIDINRLDFGRRIKLAVLVGVCRVFRAPAIHLVLEGIEIYGIRKYLQVWQRYEHDPLGKAVRNILVDEFRHEDEIVSQSGEPRITPDRIRSILFGFNDGLVEILGAVSGFFAAFAQPATVLVAGATVAVAGSISMAAGAFLATGSEREVAAVEQAKLRFLGEADTSKTDSGDHPLKTAFIVGLSYLLAAMIPLLPVFFGATNLILSLTISGVMIVIVSLVLAFLSGMDVIKRIALNLGILGFAVGVTYAIGIAAKTVWGISV